MYIEVHDDNGSKFFDSGKIKGESIELSLETNFGSPVYTVWISNFPFGFQYAKLKDAEGCYEYLKAFV